MSDRGQGMPMGYILGFSNSFVKGDFTPAFTHSHGICSRCKVLGQTVTKSPDKLEMILRRASVLLYVLSYICLSVETSCPGLELIVLFQGVEPPGGFVLNVWCPFVIGH